MERPAYPRHLLNSAEWGTIHHHENIVCFFRSIVARLHSYLCFNFVVNFPTINSRHHSSSHSLLLIRPFFQVLDFVLVLLCPRLVRALVC